MKTTKHKEEEEVDADHAVSLKQKVENAVEINSHDDSYTPGQYSHIICPMVLTIYLSFGYTTHKIIL